MFWKTIHLLLPCFFTLTGVFWPIEVLDFNEIQFINIFLSGWCSVPCVTLLWLSHGHEYLLETSLFSLSQFGLQFFWKWFLCVAWWGDQVCRWPLPTALQLVCCCGVFVENQVTLRCGSVPGFVSSAPYLSVFCLCTDTTLLFPSSFSPSALSSCWWATVYIH